MQVTNGHLDWQSIVNLKRQQQAGLLKSWTTAVCSVEENAVTGIHDAPSLAQKISSRELSATYVTTAYIKRAVAAHQQTNCLTEICFARALGRAKYLDEYIDKYGKPIGPLHGVPLTVKDQFNLKGLDTTLGYVGRSNQPAAEDAVFIQILESLGAIVLAKTNLPQTIMWCETENPLWGLTVNPRDSRLTPGGSSGGEGALLALNGSLIGLGTDIGGSVRIPAHINGLYSLKPSSGRLPYYGVPVSTEGQEHVPSVVGPLTRNLDTLHLVTKETIKAEPWLYDAKVHPLPWRQEQYDEMLTRPLVIGVIMDDGVVKVHPPIERVMKEARSKLESAGHELIDWDVSGHDECVRVLDQFYLADNGEDIRRDVTSGGEPFIPHVAALVARAEAAPVMSIYDYWQLNRQKVSAQQRQLKKWTDFRSPSGRKVDIVISPSMPHPAVPHHSCRWVGYTKVWNVLDYTAMVIPFGQVSKELDPTVAPDYVPRNEADKWNWGVYDLDVMDGHPLSVQIIGRRLDEERVLAAGKVVEEVLRA